MPLYSVYAKVRGKEEWVWYESTSKARVAAKRTQEMYQAQYGITEYEGFGLWKLRDRVTTFRPSTQQLEAVGKLIGACYFDNSSKECTHE